MTSACACTQNIPQRSHEESNMHQSVTSVSFHLFKRQKKICELKMKGNKHALADEHKHKWQDYFILWKIKRREETFKFLKKIKWRSVTGRSEGKIEGISVRARRGESLARLKGFEAAQISNTALVASRAWNLSLFGVALAANSPSSFSAWQKHFLNFPSLVLLFSQGKQSLYPWTHLPAVPNLSQTARVTQDTATPITVELFACALQTTSENFFNL